MKLERGRWYLFSIRFQPLQNIEIEDENKWIENIVRNVSPIKGDCMADDPTLVLLE